MCPLASLTLYPMKTGQRVEGFSGASKNEALGRVLLGWCKGSSGPFFAGVPIAAMGSVPILLGPGLPPPALPPPAFDLLPTLLKSSFSWLLSL